MIRFFKDRTVIIWKINHENINNVKKTVISQFEGPVWRVHWSFTGNLLAVSFASVTSDNTVQVFQVILFFY